MLRVGDPVLVRETVFGRVHQVTLVMSKGSDTGLGFQELLLFNLGPSGSEGEDSFDCHAMSACGMGYDKRGCGFECPSHPRPKLCHRKDVMGSSAHHT